MRLYVDQYTQQLLVANTESFGRNEIKEFGLLSWCRLLELCMPVTLAKLEFSKFRNSVFDPVKCKRKYLSKNVESREKCYNNNYDDRSLREPSSKNLIKKGDKHFIKEGNKQRQHTSDE